MKSFFIVLSLLFSVTCLAQEGVSVKGSTMTIKDVAPVWPGCSGSQTQKKNCFNQNLAKHIAKNFKFPKGYKPGSVKEKVVVSFVINKEGKPEIKSVKGGIPVLQEEAKRNIMSLPQMTPGQAGGKPKAISYKVPFTF